MLTFLISSGRTEAAIAEIKKAEEIDPLSLIFQTDHGEFYYFARRPDEAIAQLKKAIDMDPSFVRAAFSDGPRADSKRPVRRRYR